MSTQRRIYLDFNATAPLVPRARDAMVEALADVGNPSSIHAEGRRMRDRVERARNQVATLVGRPREQVVFTSGGTEANWLGVLALAAAAEARGLPKVVATTPLEHPSLVGAIDAVTARGWEVVTFPVSRERGVVTPGDITRAGLVAAALVNHELGTILGDDILAWARDVGALVHLDAVQAAGKLPLASLAADSLAVSAHKLGGPQGVGVLAIALDEALPVAGAGHQERGRRPGTENVLGIVGFGAAAEHAATVDWAHACELGERLASGIERAIGGSRIHAREAHRIPTTVNAGFSGALGESIVMALDLAGVSASTGAACTSGSIQPSAVLLGLGLSADEAREAVRFSLGPTTTSEEIEYVLCELPAIVARARRHR